MARQKRKSRKDIKRVGRRPHVSGKKYVKMQSTDYKKPGHPAKRGIIFSVLFLAAAMSLIFFYDAWYYSTGFAVTMPGTGTGAVDGLLGDGMIERINVTDDDDSIRIQEFNPDPEPPACALSQSTGSPVKGQEVVLAATCTDNEGLKSISFMVSETNIIEKAGKFVSQKNVSGKSATVAYSWLNPNIKENATVRWRVVAEDTNNNTFRSAPMAFTVGGSIRDTAVPSVGSIKLSSENPRAGEKISVEVQATDEGGLSGASLLVDGVVASTVELEGKSAVARFEWTPMKQRAYELLVKFTDSSGNSAESEKRGVSVSGKTCDQSDIPQDFRGGCVPTESGAGERTIITYMCNSETGKWDKDLQKAGCELPKSELPTVFIAAGIAAAVIAGAAALFLLRGRKQKPKTGKKEEPQWEDEEPVITNPIE